MIQKETEKDRGQSKRERARETRQTQEQRKQDRMIQTETER